MRIEREFETGSLGASNPPSGHFFRDMVYLEKQALCMSEDKVEQVKKDLTVESKDFGDGEVFIIECFKDIGTHLGIPYAYARPLLDKIQYLDLTLYPEDTLNAPKTVDPTHPMAPEGQAQTISQLYESILKNKKVMLVADTGTGKTAMAIAIAAKLNTKTCIVVPLKRLAEQWVNDIKTYTGLGKDDIAIIDGSKKSFSNAKISIVIGQSGWRDSLPDSFFNDMFGFVVFDECHCAGSEKYSYNLFKFNARYMLGMSATPLRQDKTQRAYYLQLGVDILYSSIKVVPCRVIVMQRWFRGVHFGKMRGSRLQSLYTDKTRLCPFIIIIMQEYLRGSNILVLSDRTEELIRVYKCLRQNPPPGFDPIPDRDIAFFADTLKSSNIKQKSTIKVNSGERQRAIDSARVILGTNGSMKMGISIPRLNVGMDLSPQTQGTQAIGRIRRVYEGKKESRWYTMLDIGYMAFQKATEKKLRELEKVTGVTIERIALD